MRLWLVDPKLLCRKHLLGEHVECHMFVGAINKGTSMNGYVQNGLLNGPELFTRHEELAAEIERRGYNHKSPLAKLTGSATDLRGYINKDINLRELARRCEECRKLQEIERNNNE
jgi:hypothetical protein